MISYDRLVELVFVVSFIINFFVGIVIFDSWSGRKEKSRDFNSPKYLASLLLGFLGGILGESFLTSLSEFNGPGQVSWLWTGIILEIAAGTIIIGTILYFLLQEALNKDGSVS
jgi:H+/Cl- antiporter ClcA